MALPNLQSLKEKFGFLSKLSGAFSLSFLSGESAVGLSIGSSSIKIAELKKAGKGWKLLHFGMAQLPDEAVVNREIVNSVAVSDSLKSLAGELKLKGKSVCAGLSGNALIIKRMSLEVPNAKEIQDQVFWEAEQYLPFEASEVVMDYHVLSRAKDSQTDVILVAVKKSVLELYMDSISASGLKPKIVDVDYFALQNTYETNYPANPQEAVAIVDIGASAMKFVVVQEGIPVFTKDTGIGGRNLTLEIQRQLNLSYTDAEALKTDTRGGGVPQEVSDLMHIMSENLAGEVKKALDFYNASSSGAPVAYVLLCGGTSRLPNLSKIVEDTVGLPVQMINPFNAVTYDSGVFPPEYIASIAPAAAVPVGLAIRAGTR